MEFLPLELRAKGPLVLQTERFPQWSTHLVAERACDGRVDCNIVDTSWVYTGPRPPRPTPCLRLRPDPDHCRRLALLRRLLVE
eukprot:744351-Pyramimonas_sp.AAC.1